MGGSVGVRSVVGEGSVFWVELAAASVEARANHSPQQLSGLRPPTDPGSEAKYSVLYVEDNLANLDLVTQILADRPNVELLRAHDGREGIAMARCHKPLVILMDLDLPDISGLEALKILRDDESTRHIPVLAVSANAMPLDIASGLAAGFFRYISKPFRIQEFLEVLDLALVCAARPLQIE
jgi:CheY-like chemotaxis protein